MKRLVITIVVGGVLLLFSIGLLLWFVVVPAFMSTGLGQAFGSALQLSKALNDSGLVDDANVKFSTNVAQGRTVRSLTVECRWLGQGPADELAATRISEIVLDRYDRLEDVDVLTIAFTQRAQVGPVNVRQAQTYSHAPADWRTRVQRLPR